jgi:hypothetical protein
MPFLHRLACFRDDVVFLVFLYQVRFVYLYCRHLCRTDTHSFSCAQRWIYRIDPKRVNEYGQVLAEDVDADAAGETKKTR